MSIAIEILFWFFGASAILFALGVLLLSKLLHAAFSLMGSFLSVAGLSMLLGAPFVAISQILIYIGGILILIVFGVFLTNKDQESVGRLFIKRKVTPLAILLAGLTMYYYFIFKIPSGSVHTLSSKSIQNTSSIGFQLMTYAALPLQLVALMLLLVLIASTWYSSVYQKEENGRF